MKKLFFTLTILLTIVSCKHKSNNSFSVTPNSTSRVTFKVKNCTKPKYYKLLIANPLPYNVSFEDLVFESDTVLTIDIDLTYPIYISLYSNKHEAEFFLIPNDTLEVDINYRNGNLLQDIVKCKGKTGTFSEYLTKNKVYANLFPQEKESVSSYNKRVNQFYNKQLETLDSISNFKNIPLQFIDIEKENITNYKIGKKVSQYGYRYDAFKQYSNNREIVDMVSNMEHYWLFSSTQLLEYVRPEKYDTLLSQKYSTPELYIQFCQENIDSLANFLKEEAVSFYITNRATKLLSKKLLLKMNELDYKKQMIAINGFIDRNADLISDSVMYNMISDRKDTIEEAYKSQNLIKEGDKAPNFYLQSINGSTVNLNDYHGKLVLINFWGTYCHPCIKSIPEKNKLVKQFENNDFVLLNICTDYNIEAWEQIIEREAFKGEHLICKGNWETILKNKYNFYGIPHYSLIDKNGIVVKNKVQIDSLNFYIKENL